MDFVVVAALVLVVVSSPDPALKVGSYLHKIQEVNAQDEQFLAEFEQAARDYRDQRGEARYQHLESVLWKGVNRRAQFRALDWCPPREKVCREHAAVFSEKGELLKELLLIRLRIAGKMAKKESVSRELGEKKAAARRLNGVNLRLRELEQTLRRSHGRV